MTVRLSTDQGKTWPAARVLYAKSAAYSSLVALPGEQVGCLYERDGYKEIVFARFGLGWLADGRATTPHPDAVPSAIPPPAKEPVMSEQTRRAFLHNSGAVDRGRRARVRAAGREGTGQQPRPGRHHGRGRPRLSLINTFSANPNVEVVAIADLDAEPAAEGPRSRREAPGQEAARRERLPQAHRRQDDRRPRHRHARPLARDPDDPRLPGGQGRLRREAGRAQHRRRQAHGRRDAQAQAHRADGLAAPLDQAAAIGASSSSRPGKLGRCVVAKAWESTKQGAIGFPPDGDAAGGRRLRHVARPGAEAAVQPQPLPRQLALVLRLRHRRPRQRRRPPARHGRRAAERRGRGAEAAAARPAANDLRQRRQVVLRRRPGVPRHAAGRTTSSARARTRGC